MTLAFRYAARSDVGLLRSVNQDSGYAGPHLLLLADGMGGPAGGDVASSVAIAHLAPLDGESHGGDMLALLRSAVVDAHTELRQRAATEPELQGLGTTLIAAMRSGKRLALAHIGDSRAYLVREGTVTQLTTDHSLVQHLVDIGQLTPAEAENHPHRSVILRVLGDHDFGVELDESMRELTKGDRYLLCSDGVSSYVSADTVAATLLEQTDPAACADALVDLALRAGGPDNITAVVADVVDLDELAEADFPDTAPQVVGAAATHWRAPTRGGTGAAARAAALLSPQSSAEDGAAPAPEARTSGAGSDRVGEADDPTARRRRRGVWVAITATVAILLAAAGFASYSWTQTQYYVAPSGEFVAIHQGIPVSLGPVSLSHPVETTDIRLDDLPAFARTRVEAGITPAEPTLAAARDVIDSLREDADDGAATASPSPSPSPTRTPSGTAGATPTASPSTASPSPEATP